MFRYKDYVNAVYKEKSFSKAAESLYISQPSLSARIIKLERSLGMPIFDRSTSPLRLTEFGEIYMEALREVDAIERRVENHISDISHLRAGKLTIGASNVFAAYVIPPLISEFQKRYPDVKIRLIEGNTETLEALLSSNEIDMVADNNRYDSEFYERDVYASERILLAVPRSFKICSEAQDYALGAEDIESGTYLSEAFASVDLSRFSRTSFVMLAPGNDTRIRADKMCREAGFRPSVALEVHQQATAYMIAATQLGATFVSDTVIKKLPRSEELCYYKIGSEAARREVCFYYKKHKYKTRAMQEFMKLIRENLLEN